MILIRQMSIFQCCSQENTSTCKMIHHLRNVIRNKNANTQSISILLVRYLHPKVLFVRPHPSETPKATNTTVVEYFGKRGEFQQSEFEKILKERVKLLEFMPKSQDEIPPRKMKDSFVSAYIPLKNDWQLRDRYLATSGQLRVGRLLEDVDIFAVYSAYHHLKLPKAEAAGVKPPHVIVTGCVDTIQITPGRVKSTEDIRMSAHVSYAGKTSLEVCVSVDQKMGDKYSATIFEAIFVLVARDAIGMGPGIVNQLIGESAEEKAFMAQAAERQSMRKFAEQESLTRRPPNEHEREIIHNHYLKRHTEPDVSQKLIGDTKSSTIFICHPQFRNHASKIFGGFIMRQAFELAYINTFTFARQRPYVIAIDDIIFLRPVEIGSFLRFRSCIGYIKDSIIHTPVVAEALDPMTGEVTISNEFNFIFKVNDPNIPLPRITFDTYKEAMTYLNSRRHYQKIMSQKRDDIGNKK